MDELDDEMLREMLAWLGRGMDESGDCPETDVPGEVELTDEDYEFLPENGIAMPS